MEKEELKKVVECLMFVSENPISAEKLADVIEDADRNAVLEALLELKKDYDLRQSPLQIVEIAKGYHISTRQQYGPWIKKLLRKRTTLRLSKSALETLAIVAYKQPIMNKPA